MLHLLSEIILSGLLHLREDHGRHLLRGHGLFSATYLNGDQWFSTFVHDLEGEQFHVLLHCGVLESPTNQTLDIKDCLCRLDCGLILGCFSNQALIIGESHIRRCDTISLVIWDNLYTAILIDTYARVRCAKIDANYWAIDLLFILLCSCTPRQGKQQCNAIHGVEKERI